MQRGNSVYRCALAKNNHCGNASMIRKVVKVFAASVASTRFAARSRARRRPPLSINRQAAFVACKAARTRAPFLADRRIIGQRFWGMEPTSAGRRGAGLERGRRRTRQDQISSRSLKSRSLKPGGLKRGCIGAHRNCGAREIRTERRKPVSSARPPFEQKALSKSRSGR